MPPGYTPRLGAVKLIKANLFQNVMGLYHHLQVLSKKIQKERLYKEYLPVWRKEPSTLRLEHPTRLERARSLGYQAKDGYVLVRVKLLRGGRQRPLIKKARKSANRRRNKIVSKSYQTIAEERAAKHYVNLEVLNSYLLAKDGRYSWYEIILVNPYSPVIKQDPKINWICTRAHTRRVFRGLTSSARKSRGLLQKGKGREKIRPSLKAHKRLSH